VHQIGWNKYYLCCHLKLCTRHRWAFHSPFPLLPSEPQKAGILGLPSHPSLLNQETHPSRILPSEGKKYEKWRILLSPLPQEEKNTKNGKSFYHPSRANYFLYIFVHTSFCLQKRQKWWNFSAFIGLLLVKT